MKKNKIITSIKKYAVITLGCLLFSLGISLFLGANNIPTGGVSGIAIVLNYLFPNFNIGLIYLFINVPLLIFGGIVFGKNFVISTCYTTVVSSLLMMLWENALAAYLPLTEDLLISSVSGAALFGVGMGLIFRMGSSSGGTDIIVKYLRKKFRYLKTGMISIIFDFVIIGLSALIMWNAEKLFYALLTSVIFTVIFNSVLYGGNSATLVYIIMDPDKAEEMKTKILHELDLGATVMNAQGAYTGNEKTVILCAVKNIYYPKLHDAVKEVDQNAFMIVTSANEVYGEGYKDHNSEEL